jgi:quercetin dioxygenase-like cupin family protein
MRSMGSRMILASSIVVATVCVAQISSDSPARKEIKRADLAGAPGMEVITSITELKKGEEFARHFHHGIEMAHVLQGSMVQVPGKEPTMIETGASLMFLREVPHAGFKVVGDTPLRYYTVHVVDKGKPLYDWVK